MTFWALTAWGGRQAARGYRKLSVWGADTSVRPYNCASAIGWLDARVRGLLGLRADTSVRRHKVSSGFGGGAAPVFKGSEPDRC